MSEEQSNQTSMAAIAAAMKKSFKERDTLIDGMVTAILAKEMLFLLGPPGTAKSAVCEALCNAISGNYFSWLVSKVTTPDELFGPISIEGLKQSRYERVTTKKLPEANIAFLDEIFKGSSAILNTLLPVINERVFHNGTQAHKIPLQVLFGASNEIPQAEELAALYDRFALRYKVDRMQRDSSVQDLFRDGLKHEIPSISLEHLAAEQAKAQAVLVPDVIIASIVELRKLVDAEGIYVSDRKWVQAIRILKAYTHLNGRTEVGEDDLVILNNVLWSSPEQEKTIRRLVSKVSNPLAEQIMKIMDAVNEINENINTKNMNPVEGCNKIKVGINQLTKLAGEGSSAKEQPPILVRALEEAKQIQKRILLEHLGMT